MAGKKLSENRIRSLSEPVTGLKGIGEKSAQLFHRCGIHTVEELLYYFPRDYDIYSEPCNIADARVGTLVAVRARLIGGIGGRYVRNLHLSTFRIGDATGEVSCTAFNMPYLKNVIHPGVSYVFRGILQKKGNRLVMDQPRAISTGDYEDLKGSMQPKYPLVKGLTNNAVVRAIKQAIPVTAYLEDILDNEERQDLQLLTMSEAVRGIHFPTDLKSFETARSRIAFDELLLFILKLRFMKRDEEKSVNYYPFETFEKCAELIERLPYRLTGDQQRIWKDIREELAGSHRMNRLIQGDVGSGKTIIAFLTLLAACENGYQGAIMAPTEVLARQHYENFSKMVREYGLPMKAVLLTGSLTAKEKKEAHAGIRDGSFNCVIGTNALIQEKAEYMRLAIVVTDEQHRFGVRQREALAGKGMETHVLSMSATPIPRTLAVILYGDLNISLLKEMPGGRIPIKNAVVDQSYREKTWKFIADQVAQGRQAYCICPMIEEGEADGLENVTDYAGKLGAAFSELFAGNGSVHTEADQEKAGRRTDNTQAVRLEVLHGKLPAREKDRIMEDFAAGRTDVLVSTTVIEVGIDVPNATVMVIENAERFGLAQLHQLRGRVGRGKYQSYCVFISTTDSEEARDRLAVMKNSNSGFEIAEEDLKQRGPGELFGIRQSGELSFHVADIYRDAALVTQASEFADRILKEDPWLEQDRHAALRERLQHAEITL